jgi:hypothetical protein
MAGAMPKTTQDKRNQPDYLAYLLRLWRVRADEEEGAVWRALLKSPLTGEQRGFASLDDLFDFLRRQAGMVLDENAGEGESSV